MVFNIVFICILMYIYVIHKNTDKYIRIQNSDFFEKSVFFCIHLYSFVCYNIYVDLNNTYFGGIYYGYFKYDYEG